MQALKGPKPDGIQVLARLLAKSCGLEELDLSCFPLTPLGIRLLASGIAAREGDGKGAKHMNVSGVTHAGNGMGAAVTSSGPSPGQGGSVPAVGAGAASSSSVTTRAATPTPPPRTPQRQIRRQHFQLPLKTLTLAVNDIGDQGASVLGDLLAGGLGKTLGAIGPRGLANLARGLAHCSILQHLDLSSNNLDVPYRQQDDQGHQPAVRLIVESWDAFARSLPKSLQHLNLLNARMSDTAVHRLVLQWHVPALVHLNLGFHLIGSAGVRLLCRSLLDMSCAKLEHLNLAQNEIGMDALPELTQASSSARIKQSILYLDLSANPLTAESRTAPEPPQPNSFRAGLLYGSLYAFAAALANCTNLYYLNLSNAGLSDEGMIPFTEGLVGAITRTMPSCRRLTVLNLA